MVKSLIRSSNYWTLNKTLVKKLGIEPAFLFTNLAEADHIMSDEDGWFYQTIGTLEEISTLSRHKQDKAIKLLEKHNLIELDLRGLPAKRYFRINSEALAKFLMNDADKIVKNQQTSELKTATNKESSYKDNDNIYTLFNYWNEKGIIKHRKMNKAMQSHINARLEEYSVEELQKAIDNYSEILKSDSYYWTHKWSLQDFMKPNNVTRFVDEAEPMKNFRKDKPNKETGERKVADF